MKRVIVVGFPELQGVLQGEGAAVETAPLGMKLAEVVKRVLQKGAPKRDTVFVVTDIGGDPDLAIQANQLSKAGFSVLVLGGFYASSNQGYGDVPTVTAPFTISQLRQTVSQLPAGVILPPIAEDDTITPDAFSSDADFGEPAMGRLPGQGQPAAKSEEAWEAPTEPTWPATNDPQPQPQQPQPTGNETPWAQQPAAQQPTQQPTQEQPTWATQQPQQEPEPPIENTLPPLDWAEDDNTTPTGPVWAQPALSGVSPQQPQPQPEQEPPTPQPQQPTWAQTEPKEDSTTWLNRDTIPIQDEAPAPWEETNMDGPAWTEPQGNPQAIKDAFNQPPKQQEQPTWADTPAPTQQPQQEQPTWADTPPPQQPTQNPFATPQQQPQPQQPQQQPTWANTNQNTNPWDTPQPQQPPAVEKGPQPYGQLPAHDPFNGPPTTPTPQQHPHMPTAKKSGPRNQVFIFTAPKGGTGKPVWLEERVSTPDGWARFGDLKPGDKVFDERGQICTVMGMTETWDDLPCYRMEFSDGTSVITAGSHEWPTWYGPEKRTIIRTTEEISKTLIKRVRERPGLAKASGPIIERKHAIVNTQPLQLPEADFLIHPYVLGVWLGDGTSANGDVTSDDPAILENVALCGYQISPGRSKQDTTALRYPVVGLTTQLRKLGVLKNKHIPAEYLRGSYEQRLALLQGLMDTDGYSDPRQSGEEFTNTNKQIIDGFVELARSLGLKPVATEGRAMLEGKDCGKKWRVWFSVPEGMMPYRLQRKLDAVRPLQAQNIRRQIVGCERVPSVPVRCIEVDSPNHLFLVGEGMVPTHNSSVSLTMSSFLAGALSNYGKSVVYVDANIGQADAGKYLRTIHQSGSIVNLANRAGKLDEVSVRQVLAQHAEYGMSILHGPPSPAEADPEVITPELYREVVQILRRMFDYVIVDTPVAEKHREVFTDFVLPEADRLVVVLTPNHVAVQNTAAWIRTISDPVMAGGDEFDDSRIEFILNQFHDDVDCSIDTVQSQLRGRKLLAVIPYLKEWIEATNNGLLLQADASLVPTYAQAWHLLTGEPALLEAAQKAVEFESGSGGRATGFLGKFFNRK